MRRAIAAKQRMNDNRDLSNRGIGAMQVLVEILAVVVVWAAALLLSPFGVDVGFARPAEASRERTVERTPPPEPVRPTASDDCPEGSKARLQPV